MNNPPRSARLWVESLESRETPSGAVTGRITGVAADPATVDAPATVRVAAPNTGPSADPLPVLMVIADRNC